MSGGAVREGAQVIAIDPADVMIPERIGFLHEDKAAALGRLMAVDGQRDPIKVVRVFPSKTIETCRAEGNRPWRLVVGMHRLQGCLIEAIPVLAIEVKGKPEELAELEASENIDRRDIGPLEKAKFVVALADVARARVAAQLGENLSDQQLAIKARWMRAQAPEAGLHGLQKAVDDEVGDTCRTMQRVYGWQDSVRDAFGLHRASIWRFIKLYRTIVEPFPELAQELAKHPVVGENLTQLLKISDLREDVRRKVIEALIADPEIGVEDAKVAVGVAEAPYEPLDPTSKFKDAIIGNWNRLQHRKLQFIPTFAALLTKPQALAMQEAVAQRLAELGDGDE